MIVLFTQTRRLCEDGFTVNRYEKGQKYDLAHTAAVAAIAAGWAVKVQEVAA